MQVRGCDRVRRVLVRGVRNEWWVFSRGEEGMIVANVDELWRSITSGCEKLSTVRC